MMDGYSSQTFDTTFGTKKGVLLKGNGPRTVIKFDQATNKPTGEVINMKIDMYFLGMGVQEVKMPKGFSLTADVQDMQDVELVNPQACIIGNNVYVKADGIK